VETKIELPIFLELSLNGDMINAFAVG